MADPIRVLVHDHGEIDRRVRAAGSMLAELERVGSTFQASLVPASFAAMLGDLREALFLHFAREEEGLFPFVVETIPELGARVHEMEVAHDAICGALARAVELARVDAALPSIAALFRRFEAAYAEHARVEVAVLQAVDDRLDSHQRGRLAALVAGV